MSENQTVLSHLTLAQARKGGITDAVAVVKDLGKRHAGYAAAGDNLTYDTAMVFHAVVVTDKAMSAVEFVKGIGKSQSMGTTYRRLSSLALRFNLTASSRAWKFLVQRGTSQPVKDQVVDVEDDDTARANLGTLVENYFSGKEAEKQEKKTRKARPNDGAEGEPESGSEPITETLTVAKVLDLIDAAAKSADREGWAQIENRLQAIITRENTLRVEQARQSA